MCDCKENVRYYIGKYYCNFSIYLGYLEKDIFRIISEN